MEKIILIASLYRRDRIFFCLNIAALLSNQNGLWTIYSYSYVQNVICYKVGEASSQLL